MERAAVSLRSVYSTTQKRRHPPGTLDRPDNIN